MSKKSIVFILIIFILIFFLNFKFSSKELDRIENYAITVTPQEDGSLILIYDIRWKVLDSTTEGPLTWVQIGIPNSNVDNITALSSNISNIEQYNSTYVKIDFKQSYNANEVVNFKFKIHQKNMYSLDGNNCVYKFTPGWFKDIAVDNITVKWKSTNVLSANTEKKENGFYVWNDSLKKNEKLKVHLEYDQRTFKELTATGDVSHAKNSFNSYNSPNTTTNLVYPILLVGLVILFIVISVISPDNYYRHRGYGYSSYDDRDHYRSSCVSSCACVKSCACACACAGGGRAGCSKKDFYGTKLNSKKILEHL